MTNWKGTKGYAKYQNFKIAAEASKFQLQIGRYSGTAGKDSLAYHNNAKFTTKDADNDTYKTNCAITHEKGAWWYRACDHCGLNGLYNVTNSDMGVEWDGFPNGKYMKSTKMMFRCK
ncbi:hypothetical protein FSP39_019903 [Pinctada imbricata]|uniref:Fibrinogen C-terminal domain-containing protein n=1 Tax=Pinctada imbricata TaxID=66713 RepID=A0AA88YV40_PINIB|nr:hypothetical protein FSP39_019903 [Pinctada imbricata]